MKVAVLTSSRADFGIYLPLLSRLKKEVFVEELKIIAFGTHCSTFYGNTVSEIFENGFENVDLIKTVLASDDEESISTSYGLTVLKFSTYWNDHHFDYVFCLGDRYEMSAAVQAGIPYGIQFIHLFGGDTTIGAIDNIYRHQITLASAIHFTSTDLYKNRVAQLIGSTDNIYNVGDLSLDGLEDLDFPNEETFRAKYRILAKEFILITFHPETVESKKNSIFAEEMNLALEELRKDYFLVITMPNSDTQGSLYRQKLYELKKKFPDNVALIESFGKTNYFTAMHYTSLMVGNTSSGILEAASFGNYVVNVGNRQKGRAQSRNIINVPFLRDSIVTGVRKGMQRGKFTGNNIYNKPNTAINIIKVLKERNE